MTFDIVFGLNFLIQESGIRLAEGETVLKLPGGREFRVKGTPPDVDVWNHQTNEWLPGITYGRGTGGFRGQACEPGHPVGEAACSLAKLLHANIFVASYPLY